MYWRTSAETYVLIHNLVATVLHLEIFVHQHSIPAPPPRDKIYSADDHVTLEDESGRIQLVGEKIEKERLVTGVILGALGYENSNGDFQVVDVCYAGMAAQPAPAEHTNEMDVDDTCNIFCLAHKLSPFLTRLICSYDERLIFKNDTARRICCFRFRPRYWIAHSLGCPNSDVGRVFDR